MNPVALTTSGAHRTVYEGWDVLENCPVILKVTERYRPSTDEPLDRDWVEADNQRREAHHLRELAAAGVLKGPGLPSLRSAGTLQLPAGERSYSVWNYVEGIDLSEVLGVTDRARSSRPPRVLPLYQTRALGLALLDALAPVHAQGWVHADVQPTNVRCGPRVVIIELGSAVLQHQRGTDDWCPDTAPEELRFNRPLTPATDLFSVAATLVIAAGGIIVGPLNEWCPSFETSFRERRPEAGDAWCRFFERALRRVARQRFQTVDEMRATLRMLPTEGNRSPAHWIGDG
jgi:hypothetical protein